MFLPDPTPDNRVQTLFLPAGSVTLPRPTVTLPDAGARARMLATGMAHGMEANSMRIDAQRSAGGQP